MWSTDNQRFLSGLSIGSWRIMQRRISQSTRYPTIGQLNFFKWAIENQLLEYIEKNYDEIEVDMNARNSISKKGGEFDNNKTRKKREELSISACKTIKKETVNIVVKFN